MFNLCPRSTIITAYLDLRRVIIYNEPVTSSIQVIFTLYRRDNV